MDGKLGVNLMRENRGSIQESQNGCVIVIFKGGTGVMNENITKDFTKDKIYVKVLIDKAREAMKIVEDYNQTSIDCLCQAVG